MRLTRRDVLIAGTGAGFACTNFLTARYALADDETQDLVAQLIGQPATPSDRLHLTMPAVFPTGYTVPMDIDVDTPMAEADHVRQVRVFAPLNPIIEVVGFHFVVRRSLPRVSTRIRLAKPQHVIAVAKMNDGAWLMSATRVEVASNGCA